MNRIIAALLLVALAACSQEKATDHASQTEQPSAEKPVAEPSSAAQTYYDGTDTKPWLALNAACKKEAAENKRGVNCDAYQAASDKVNALIHANPGGFVGLRVKLN